jgi:hypothetical protein
MHLPPPALRPGSSPWPPMTQTIIVSATRHAPRTTAASIPSTSRQGSGATWARLGRFSTKTPLTFARARAGAPHQLPACHRARARARWVCSRLAAAHRDHASRRGRGQLEGREPGCRVVAGSFPSLVFGYWSRFQPSASQQLRAAAGSQPGKGYRTPDRARPGCCFSNVPPVS